MANIDVDIPEVANYNSGLFEGGQQDQSDRSATRAPSGSGHQGPEPMGAPLRVFLRALLACPFGSLEVFAADRGHTLTLWCV